MLAPPAQWNEVAFNIPSGLNFYPMESGGYSIGAKKVSVYETI